MTPTVRESAGPLPESKSLFARVIGVLFTPRATYANVAARPRWVGAMALVAALSAAGLFVFLSTEVGQQATFDQQVRTMESFGMKLNDAALQRMEERLPRARYTIGLSQLIVLPIIALIVAGVAIGVFNALLGGDSTFAQVYAIVAHSGIVIAIGQLFALPIDYARETMSSPANLAVFLPFLDESAFAARFLGVIDLFQIWWIVSLAIGLAVLYKKRTSPIASTMMGVYVLIAFVIAVLKSAA